VEELKQKFPRGSNVYVSIAGGNIYAVYRVADGSLVDSTMDVASALRRMTYRGKIFALTQTLESIEKTIKDFSRLIHGDEESLLLAVI
jgi:hypothetical protein